MASKKKKIVARKKAKKAVAKAKRKPARASKPITKKKARAPKKPKPLLQDAVVEQATTQVAVFDVQATQAISVTEVVGEIEERMALDKLTES